MTLVRYHLKSYGTCSLFMSYTSSQLYFEELHPEAGTRIDNNQGPPSASSKYQDVFTSGKGRGHNCLDLTNSRICCTCGKDMIRPSKMKPNNMHSPFPSSLSGLSLFQFVTPISIPYPSSLVPKAQQQHLSPMSRLLSLATWSIGS